MLTLNKSVSVNRKNIKRKSSLNPKDRKVRKELCLNIDGFEDIVKNIELSYPIDKLVENIATGKKDIKKELEESEEFKKLNLRQAGKTETTFALYLRKIKEITLLSSPSERSYYAELFRLSVCFFVIFYFISKYLEENKEITIRTINDHVDDNDESTDLLIKLYQKEELSEFSEKYFNNYTLNIYLCILLEEVINIPDTINDNYFDYLLKCIFGNREEIKKSIGFWEYNPFYHFFASSYFEGIHDNLSTETQNSVDFVFSVRQHNIINCLSELDEFYDNIEDRIKSAINQSTLKEIKHETTH